MLGLIGRGRWRRNAVAGALAALGGAAIAMRPARVPAASNHAPQAAPHSASSDGANAEQRAPSPASSLASRIELGRALFFDAALSEPAGTSCASCHDPERAFAGMNGSSTGVPRGSRPGHFARRNAPSLYYLKYVPKFHFYQDDDAVRPAPFGGFFWNGRSDSIHELVKEPLLNPDEMNNGDARRLAAKVNAASYGDSLRRELGADVERPEATMQAVGSALEAFLTSEEMAPFSSRYDAFVSGRGKLTPYEMTGMRLFKDPAKGGCIACHRFYDSSREPSSSMFTDYGFDALGVPRNDRLPRGHAPDVGLCERHDATLGTDAPEYCASFRTPSLRNVAVRAAYMHNGVFTNLRDVVAFYATRATDPKRWYKSGVKFDDVPAKYRGQVNVASIPYNRREGDVPALDDREIDAIVAFLQTLTDAPPAAPLPRRTDKK
jgi:cytochrome c peroxidase